MLNAIKARQKCQKKQQLTKIHEFIFMSVWLAEGNLIRWEKYLSERLEVKDETVGV